MRTAAWPNAALYVMLRGAGAASASGICNRSRNKRHTAGGRKMKDGKAGWAGVMGAIVTVSGMPMRN